MKKSNIIKLVLVSTIATACSKPEPKEKEWTSESGKKVYMRSDTTARYSRARHHGSFIPFFVFRPYGLFSNGSYSRMGYSSNSISSRSNFGSNSSKSSYFSRSGFGSSSRRVSS